MKVRVGRTVLSPPLSVHDLMSASVALMISRTVKPEGPDQAAGMRECQLRGQVPMHGSAATAKAS